MKKKGQIAILLTLVLAIWGYIGFKIFSNLSDFGEPDTSPTYNLPNLKSADGKKEIYQLDLNYKDPFLKPKSKQNNASPAGNQIKKAKIEKKIVKPKKKIIQWPAINFKGSVENKNGEPPLYIVEINRVNYFYKLHDVFQELKLIKAAADSIQLEFLEEEKRVFKIK